MPPLATRARQPWLQLRPQAFLCEEREGQPKEIKPEYSLEGLMLKLQYFGFLMGRADSLEKTLMLETIEGKGAEGGRR